VQDPQADIRDAAVRALCSWKDAAAAPDLLRLARGGATRVHRVLALRGFVRLVGLPSRRPAAETLALYRQAMGAAQGAQEKKLVLAGVAGVACVEALELAEAHLADEALAGEAAAAVVRIARAVAGAHPAEAKAALKRVAEGAEAKRTQKEARRVLAEIERAEQYLTAWSICGPYSKRGTPGKQLLGVAFPPEDAKAAEVKWRPLTGAGWLIDLRKLVGGENRAVYLRTRVHSDREQDARLELGSDDGVKVWLNGRLVHANNATRGCKPEEDKVSIHLTEGCNELLVKVTQGIGGWGFCGRLRTPDGSKPLSNIRVSAD
jgi:hypothetical protein